MSAVRRSDAPGTSRPGPNGFHGEEICQIMRYAGISEKITSIGIYELDPWRDQDKVTAQLAAQMVWCFLDGFRSRTNDLPWLDRKRFTRFRIPIRGHEQELVFYKSTVSDRWWMDIPTKPNRRPVSNATTWCLARIPITAWPPVGKRCRTAGGAPSRSLTVFVGRMVGLIRAGSEVLEFDPNVARFGLLLYWRRKLHRTICGMLSATTALP
jgi:hypothetical protein